MKRNVRLLICVSLFLLLTAVKMVAPAAAAELKAAALPVLDRQDDVRPLLRQAERRLFPKALHVDQWSPPEPPLVRLRQTLEAPREDPMASLPKASPLAEPSPEPTENPALLFGNAVKETFLQAQAAISDQAPPENVSYEVAALPFAETTPVAGYTSSGFGYRIHPIQNNLRFHYGTDFAADAGTEILAFADGTVLAAGEDAGYGNYVKLDHGDGYVTLYGHCSQLLVSEGTHVSRGQTIALVGATGQATGPHLHFELIHHGVYLNPEFYLYA